MKQVRLFRASGLAVITSMLSLMPAAQTGDTAAIQQYLNSQFRLTTMTADRLDISAAGDVAVIHKPGLIMYSVASPMPPSNTYKNGKIGQGWSGFGKDMAITMMTQGGGTAANYPHRPFAPEERCWVTGVHAQNDGVLFQLYSDSYDGIRYYANLKIPYPNKKGIPPVEAVMQFVAEVLTTDNQGGQPAPDQGSQPALPAPEPVPAPAFAPIPPPPTSPSPAPMQEIAPPPPPSDAQPPTIALGQTMDQVTANFGQPARIAKLGAKVIYYYKDMKVTFLDGQVSDVQ